MADGKVQINKSDGIGYCFFFLSRRIAEKAMVAGWLVGGIEFFVVPPAVSRLLG